MTKNDDIQTTKRTFQSSRTYCYYLERLHTRNNFKERLQCEKAELKFMHLITLLG